MAIHYHMAMIATASTMILSVFWCSESMFSPTMVGTFLLQLGIPLLILAQVHWVAQELYLHRPWSQNKIKHTRLLVSGYTECWGLATDGRRNMNGPCSTGNDHISGDRTSYHSAWWCGGQICSKRGCSGTNCNENGAGSNLEWVMLCNAKWWLINVLLGWSFANRALLQGNRTAEVYHFDIGRRKKRNHVIHRSKASGP
jgi:hypothetical protein